MLLSLIAISAITLILVAFSGQVSNLSVGADQATFFLGFPRAIYGFATGVILFRLQAIWSIYIPRINFVLISTFLLMILSIPGKDISNKYALPIDAFLMLVVIPLFVMLSIQSKPMAWMAKPLGHISYPLYAIHYPFVVSILIFLEHMHEGVGNYKLEFLKFVGSIILFALTFFFACWIEGRLIRFRRRSRIKQLNRKIEPITSRQHITAGYRVQSDYLLAPAPTTPPEKSCS